MQPRNTLERYHRQMILPELGSSGQEKLLAASVLVVGAGGLGCPVLQYLAAAGVGTIGIVDDDVVSLTNLQRQVLYGMPDLQQLKVNVAAMTLKQMNPDVQIVPYAIRLTNKNALDIFEPYDIIVDASDNFATRYLVNDACVLLAKPLVYGAVSRFEGQLSVFNVQGSATPRAPNYRDLFPQPPKEGEIANCAETGVLGVLTGIIGSLQAAEVIKLITHMGHSLTGHLQTFNLLINEWYTCELALHPAAEAALPKDRNEFIKANYELTCTATGFIEINGSELISLMSKEQPTIIDVREYDELPAIDDFEHLQIPLSALSERLASIPGNNIVTICQLGMRSKKAAALLSHAFPNRHIYSLQGGITSWNRQFKNQEHE